MKLSNCWTADFETTTDLNDCRVWAYSMSNVEDQTFIYGTSIEEFFENISEGSENYKIWFHNLKFDGNYILHYLFTHNFKWVGKKEDIEDNTFTTLITDMGQFYSIVVYFKKYNRKYRKVEFFDSLKIFPNFSVEKVAEGFNLPIRKLSIDYKKYRPVGYQLDENELAYIRNDVEIMSLALNFMFRQGMTRMTIASDALADYKKRVKGFRQKFPHLALNIDEDIRNSYRGGFTYVNDKYRDVQLGKCIVLDVNSLYPSCMVDYPLPYGTPVFFEGEYEQDNIYPLYVQSITCRFEIKENKIPSIQIKNSLNFTPNEYITSSNGEEITLYLTKPDFELFKMQYNIYNPTYNGGWKFMSATGMFEDYINHWMSQKIKAGKEGNAPLKQLSKLCLNSLYGKFGTNPHGRLKEPYLGENGIIHSVLLPEKERSAGYVAIASYVTAYGRFKTITSSQAIRDFTMKKYGEDRYYYSDTDSIHANLSPEDLEELKDIIKVDDYKLGYWKQESVVSRCKFIRQKCYVEEIDGKLKVTISGLPKELAPIVTFENFKKGFTTAGLTLEMMKEQARKNGANEEEIKKIKHKLHYTYTQGGVVLTDTDFTIK